MFKVNNRNNRTRCEICSKLTIKTPERRHKDLIKNNTKILKIVKSGVIKRGVRMNKRNMSWRIVTCVFPPWVIFDFYNTAVFSNEDERALRCLWIELQSAYTAWKVSKYRVFSGPYLDPFHAVIFDLIFEIPWFLMKAIIRSDCLKQLFCVKYFVNLFDGQERYFCFLNGLKPLTIFYLGCLAWLCVRLWYVP